MTGPIVFYGGVTNTDPTQLAAPSLAASPPTDTLTVRTVSIVAAGPASWPGTVQVQYQTSPDNSVWTNSALSSSGLVLNLTRGASATTTYARGYATNGGTLTDSALSGVVVIPVPSAFTAVTAGGTPLAWRLRTLPVDRGLNIDAMSGDPVTAPLLLREYGPNRFIVDTIQDVEVASTIVPTAVAWRALTASSVLLGSGTLTVDASGAWRGTLTPSPQLRVLEIAVTAPAPDASITTVQYPVTLDP